MKKFGFVLTLLAFCSCAFAREGGVTSGGGDSVSAEFTQIARFIAGVIRTQTTLPVSAAAFDAAINSTLVVSKRRTILNGNEMEAINYPSQHKIEVNRTRWLENKDAIQRRYVLVAHEYLGILGLDDKRYQISGKLFDVPGVAKNTIRCRAFDDDVMIGGHLGDYVLELNHYQSQTIALVKNTKGELPALSSIGVGSVAIGGTLDTIDGVPTALVAVSLGFSIRMLQIPVGRPNAGEFKSVSWDVKGAREATPIRKVACTQINW